MLHRENEQALLNAFLHPLSILPYLIVQGYKSLGKTTAVLHHLNRTGIKHTVVNCDECITHKILLQRCLKQIKEDSGIDTAAYKQKYIYKGIEAARISVICENVAYFLQLLEQFVEDTDYIEPHVLVLDRFDQCCAATDELLAALLKMREHSLVKNISVVFITSHEDPREIATFSIPHIWFGPYLEEEATSILQQKNLCSLEGAPQLWSNFLKLVVNIFYDYSGSDILILQELCYKLWPKFAEPIASGVYDPSDFVRLYRDIKDEVFSDSVICNSHVIEYGTSKSELFSSASPVHDLPYHSKFILLAAYLASHIETKNDMHIFSKVTENKKKRSKASSAREVDSRLLSANMFDLERLKAILLVIYRNELKLLSDEGLYVNLYKDMTEREIAKKEQELASFTINPSVDVNTQLSTLVSLGLISRTYALDTLLPRIRWKCNVGWDVINRMSEEIAFPIANYVA